MPKYRKLPIVIEAIQYDGSSEGAKEAFELVGASMTRDLTGHLYIQTLEGAMQVRVGDYIIRGVQGEFYPCKPDIFLSTYEAVDA